MTIDEMIEVLQAAKAGKKIQARSNGEVKDGDWIDGEKWHNVLPNWDFYHCDFRVKPEPREWLAYVTPDGKLRSRSDCYTGDRVADIAAWKEIQVREVLE